MIEVDCELKIDDFTSAMVNDEIRFGFRMGRAYKGDD